MFFNYMKKPLRNFSAILLILALTMASCHLNSQRVNDADDLNEAEIVLNSYWNFKLNNQIDSLSSTFSKRAFEKISKSKLDTLFKNSWKTYGPLQGYSMKDWSTFVVNGTDARGEYKLAYESRFLKDTIIEIFYLQRNAEDKIELVEYSYNVLP